LFAAKYRLQCCLVFCAFFIFIFLIDDFAMCSSCFWTRALR
jgi:hypothetical protein